MFQPFAGKLYVELLRILPPQISAVAPQYPV